jgi:hypothetical protein
VLKGARGKQRGRRARYWQRGRRTTHEDADGRVDHAAGVHLPKAVVGCEFDGTERPEDEAVDAGMLDAHVEAELAADEPAGEPSSATASQPRSIELVEPEGDARPTRARSGIGQGFQHALGRGTNGNICVPSASTVKWHPRHLLGTVVVTYPGSKPR